LILLGSRGDEAWLAKGTFGNNVYTLSGLDTEAASQLADKILAYHHVSHYSEDEQHREDLQKLLKLLAGYPLALEVVLANLAQQTPKEVLSALEAGDESIDFSSEKKTESILQCIDYSYGNLSAAAQKLLLCLAPFTGVFNINALSNYTEKLRQQPILADLPFEQWESVLQEATNWGLLSPHPDAPFILRLQPIFPYFLRNHLQSQPDYQEAIDIAFRQHYDEIGGALVNLFESKEADDKQLGQVLVPFEYENLSKALDLALITQVSIENPYKALSYYLDTTQDHAQGLALSEGVLVRLENYPAETLQGQLGAEFVGVLDDIAKRQLLLKQYTPAAHSYQKALELIENLADINEKQRGGMNASVYHQLGNVAQEQHQWQAAEQYYQKTLAIYIEFNEKYEQAGTYHQLGRVAQEQHQWQAAEHCYQKALAIYVEINDRYSQARTYHNFGYVAQEQQQWQAAEQYYQKALAIKIEFNEKYEQASTYHNLGLVAQEQQQWQQAKDYFLKALNTYVEFDDSHSLGVVLKSLARLHKATNDDTLPAAVAKVLGISVEKLSESGLTG